MADKNEGMLGVSVLLASIHVRVLMNGMDPEDLEHDHAAHMKMTALYGASIALQAVMRAKLDGDPLEANRHIDSEMSKISLVMELLDSGMSVEDVDDVLNGVGEDRA